MLDTPSPITAIEPVSIDAAAAQMDDLLRHVIDLGLDKKVSPDFCTGAMQALTAAKLVLIGDPVFARVLMGLSPSVGQSPVRPKFGVIEGGNHDRF